jgi:hypothetical protein
LRQDKKRSLKGVLRLVLVPQDRPAQTYHDRPVPLDEHGEGVLRCLSAMGHEPFEQLTVRHRACYTLVDKRDKLMQ